MVTRSQGEDELEWHLQAASISYAREYPFARPRRFRADFFVYPDLLIEVEGGVWSGGRGRHTSGAGFTRDCEKYNEAVLRGYRVLRFTTEQVSSGLALDTIIKALG